MGHIVKIKDMYLEWSSIVDAPTTYGMTLDELTEHIRYQQGVAGLYELPYRLERVEKTGSSEIGGSIDDVKYNRAGPNETKLTVEEIYDAYCLRKPIRKGWIMDDNHGGIWVKRAALTGGEGER